MCVYRFCTCVCARNDHKICGVSYLIICTRIQHLYIVIYIIRVLYVVFTFMTYVCTFMLVKLK